MLKILNLCLFSLLSCLSLTSFAEDPLDPAQAFRFSAQVVDAHTVEARWDIAPGYYLYRDKIAFSVTPGTVGKVVLPAGQTKEDPNFGSVETYRDTLRVQVPVNASGHITLNVTSQGCADLGVCYPPQKHAVELDLPAAGNTATAEAANTAATETWQNRMARPQLYGPAILGLIGVMLAAVPMRIRRGLWFKGAGFALMFIAALMLLSLNREDSAPTAPAQANQSH
ncbi:MAG TPA: protein-disulfide reductase DsbD N-terminal domain-containing protein [Rhodocyclaceae bacterium]|jgi:thiol:disulfide interchange protein|nr:protein-disulfide reductase DsbD N-terminal domain-containing protein [Rhodocyclaceae bacterium]